MSLEILQNFQKIKTPELESLFLIRLQEARSQASASKFIKKETLAKVFSSEFRKISGNTFLIQHLQATASEILVSVKISWYEYVIGDLMQIHGTIVIRNEKTFDVCWGSLGTSIFGNSSSATNNTQSRLPSRLSFCFLWLWWYYYLMWPADRTTWYLIQCVDTRSFKAVADTVTKGMEGPETSSWGY